MDHIYAKYGWWGNTQRLGEDTIQCGYKIYAQPQSETECLIASGLLQWYYVTYCSGV